jgi:hypothetical protein
MKTAPVYIVSFANGSCGSLISALIERFCSPWINTPILPGKYNSAHRMMVKPNYRSTRKQYARLPAKEFFAGLERIMPWHPTFIETHFFGPRYMIEKFPEAKILAITLTDNDIAEVATNSFFKFVIGEGRDTLAIRSWQYIQQAAFFIADSMSLAEIEQAPKETLQKCVKLRQGDTILSGFHLIEEADKFGDNVTFLPYSSIMNRPEETLEILSKFTGQETTDYIRQEYYLYLERQKEFMKEVEELLSGG